MKSLKSLAIALACAALGTAAAAQTPAYTAKDAHLRAGPARDYPVVAILQSGVSIMVQGCLSDYTWCDVTVGTDRGWVYAKNIVYPYQGANQPVIAIGALIGIGILAFSLNEYWDSHYVARPWYPQRHRWVHRPPPPPPRAFGPGGPRPLPAPQPRPPGLGQPHAQPPGAAHPQVPPPGATHPRPPQSPPPGAGTSRPPPAPAPAPGSWQGVLQPKAPVAAPRAPQTPPPQGAGQHQERDRRGGQGH